MLLEKKAAIVIGGARGMGRAVALRFADEGASTCIADVLDKDGEECVKLVQAKGVDCMYVHTDVTKIAEVEAMVAKAVAKFGKVEILVNCAGIGRPPMVIANISDEEYDKVVAVNMKGIFNGCKAIAPHLSENKYGKVVNICSIAGISPTPVSMHYAAAKAGALHISHCFAKAMAKDNVTVNAILPGMIRTDMTRDFAPPEIKDLDGLMAKLVEGGVPLGREGTVEDIASAVLFLSCEMSSYITGEAIAVGGGSK